MTYTYKAYDADNNLVQGEIEAGDTNKAHLFLVEQGYEVLSVQPVTSVKKKKGLQVELAIGSVSLEQKMLFVKHLSLMIRSGMPLNESLSILRTDSKGKLKVILGKVLASVEGGKHLAASLHLYPRVFNKFFVSMVEVGEQSGTLEKSLNNLAEHLRKSNELTSKIRSALLYPTIVLVAIVGLGFSLAVFVLPKLTSFFSTLDAELPLSTKVLIWTSGYFQAYWLQTLIGLIIVVVLISASRFFAPTRNILHHLYLMLPVVKLFAVKSNLATFCRSMSLLLESGLPLDRALEIAHGNTTNMVFTRDIKSIMEQVQRGESLGATMQNYSRRFPIIVSRMITVGEKSGNLSETFSYLASFYEDEIDTLSKNLSSVIEPVLLVFIGGVVAFVAMSIITPIYDLTASVAN